MNTKDNNEYVWNDNLGWKLKRNADEFIWIDSTGHKHVINYEE